MGMTSGTLVAETAFRATGVFPPPGLTTSLTSATVRQTGTRQANFTFGTAESEVDTIVMQDRSLAASGTATYDIYTGTDLKDVNSNSAPFRRVRLLGVYVVSGGGDEGVSVGGAGANCWGAFFSDTSDKVKVFPGGVPYLGGSPDGVAVGSTTKNLLLTNLSSTAAVVVRIVIGGTIQPAGGFRGFYLPTLTYP
jgi:uncharacterized protein YaiE (UPF0345 family)